MNTLPVAISVGDPAGIGPDIVLAAARRSWPARLVVIADKTMLRERADAMGLAVELVDYYSDGSYSDGSSDTVRDSTEATPPPGDGAGRLVVLHEPLAFSVTAGIGDPRNAAGVLAALRRAVVGCENGEFAALVTAPVNKAMIADSGVAFLGHTEYLAELTGARQVVMLLAGADLRVALATTHMPLAKVPAAVCEAPLVEILRVLDADLKTKFRIPAPRIGVLGLNPHAGEGGHLGHEEQAVISPAIEMALAEGIAVSGPWPADTAFNATIAEQTDAYLAMYHDQGLPVLKHASFGAAVNVTLGLPIIRTSVDHGTAYDIAGTGLADPSSLFAAIELAIELGNSAS